MTIEKLVKTSDIKKPLIGKGKSIFRNKENFLLNPYSERIASLIRLVQVASKEQNIDFNKKTRKAVCICIYIDKKNQVFYANNIIPDPSYKNFENEGFLKDIPIISELFEKINEKREENIERFIVKAFDDKNEIFLNLKTRNLPIINQVSRTPKSKINEQIKSIFSTLEEFYKNSFTKQTNQYEEIFFRAEKFKKKLEKKIKDLKKDNFKNILRAGYLIPIISTLKYVEDFLNVYDLGKDKDLTFSEKVIIDSISKKSIKRATCQGNHNVHCEMRM
jgi:ElaB/YqjD/DUF883 family membrane-anchored ribosome-binding protein